jgi:hypothetical protein
MNQISDEISMKRFLSHINRRDELRTIYALVGKNYLDMLNELALLLNLTVTLD